MAKKTSSRKSRRTSSRRKGSSRKYSRKASQEVRTEMHHKKSGKHPVKSRKQAIAIGLSQARRAGGKVPRRRRRK